MRRVSWGAISKTIDDELMTRADAQSLLSARAVRSVAQRMLAHARAEQLEWRIDFARMQPTAELVANVIRERYPALDPGLHARWRHFVFAGRDLGREVLASQRWPDAAAKARAAFDLVITSVLLDAGAGPTWRYRDAALGIEAVRSEGLALASLRWFARGGFSVRADEPLRADAAALQRIDVAALQRAFQVDAGNPLAGARGRAQLLNRLGAALPARPELFAIADSPRLGGLFDALQARAVNGSLPAGEILELLLDAFGSIWENRPALEGVPLGDCWPHPALRGHSPADHFVPLHKLSQWLAYSLIEPLQAAGIVVRELDSLTGLAEYRNGGLFVDLGVLVPRDPTALAQTHRVSDPIVVAWRSLTVALLDELAPLVRERLQLQRDEFPLAKLLEGGTWAAGRKIARQLRADGGPPFNVSSDGTVF